MPQYASLYATAAALAKSRKLTHNAECGNVGAALLAENGKIYSGICIDNSCGIGTCAEHAAILDMLKEGVTRIHEIIAVNDKKIVLSPCGRCREMMMQINKENCNALVHLPKQRELKLSELLPEYWF